MQRLGIACFRNTASGVLSWSTRERLATAELHRLCETLQQKGPTNKASPFVEAFIPVGNDHSVDELAIGQLTRVKGATWSRGGLTALDSVSKKASAQLGAAASRRSDDEFFSGDSG